MRTDIHKPSSIVPADYDFVGHECEKVAGLGAIQIAIQNRAIIQAHMSKTGGFYSGHDHGGNCMVCGSVNAIYTLLFHHRPTNVYVRVGADCAEKIFNSDFGANRFRAAIDDVRQAQAGKRKAEALLNDLNIPAAWTIYTTKFEGRIPYEESTVINIVGKLIKYGKFASDAQVGLLVKLVERIPERDKREADRKAQRELEAANAAPVVEGRQTISGEVLKAEWRETHFGAALKITVKTVDGRVFWGTAPSALGEVTRGQQVVFVATVEKTDRPNFGFFKRPSVTKAMAAAAGSGSSQVAQDTQVAHAQEIA
jgi:hypothetical protein